MKTTFTLLFACLFIHFTGFSQEKNEISDLVNYNGPYFYPNPATNHLTLNYGYFDEFGTEAWVQFETKGLVDMFAIGGQQAINTINLSDQIISQEIPISDLRSGIYFLVIRFDEEEPIVMKVAIL